MLNVFDFNYLIQVIHIKRFQYTTVAREKLFTDVQFPLNGLNMQPFLSDDRLLNLSEHKGNPAIGRNSEMLELDRDKANHGIYDLLGVVHHSGGINGGHYVAHVSSRPMPITETSSAAAPGIKTKLNMAPSTQTSNVGWTCFNDAHVSPISSTHITGPSAYILFYQLRKK